MRILVNLMLAVLFFTASIVLAEESAAPLADPTIILVRDDAVRDELACTAEQREAIDELLRKHNRMLLAIRDVSPTGADASAQTELKEIRTALAELFTKEQKIRLQGITLQAQGYDALLRKDIIAALKLSKDQQAKLAEINDDFREQAQGLQKQSGEHVGQQLQKFQAERHKRIVEVLDSEQETQLGKLLGAPFDFDKVVKSPAWAPEFEGIEEWVNSEPLTMAGLRGKVVVIHFFAFGCSNCIHNYPWYQEWHEAFQGQDVALIGIHTPETKSEADNNLLRESIESHKLKFPVAVDKQKKMWTAWYNGIWPSVYLVDRRGRVRYWWYGELDWQGAGNQKVARKQIEELLAERPSSNQTSAAQ